MNPSSLRPDDVVVSDRTAAPSVLFSQKERKCIGVTSDKRVRGLSNVGTRCEPAPSHWPRSLLVYRTATLTYRLKNQAQSEESSESHRSGSSAKSTRFCRIKRYNKAYPDKTHHSLRTAPVCRGSSSRSGG